MEIYTKPVPNSIPVILDHYKDGKLVEVSVWVVNK